MNYATQHHIGNYQHTRTETTTAIAPTVGRVRQLATKTKGRKPSAERQAEIRTNSNATNGILKCTFLPKLKTAKSVHFRIPIEQEITADYPIDETDEDEKNSNH